MRPGPVEAEIVSYDDHRGDGWLSVEGEQVWFHCTQIADGSRTIPEGAWVTATLAPGLLGRLEAHAIRQR